MFGVGYDTAAKLLIAAGDNPQRLRSEAAWAHLCGVAPLPASSRKTIRQANRALCHVMITRLSHHEPTNAYVARRLAHGKTLGKTGRMLKRYIAREVYKQLPRPA